MAQHTTMSNFGESPKFQYPGCGIEVFNDQGQPRVKPCVHVLFRGVVPAGEFYDAADECNGPLENDENCFLPSEEEILSQCLDTVVLLARVSSGMAWRPVGLTVFLAIKFPEAIWDQHILCGFGSGRKEEKNPCGIV